MKTTVRCLRVEIYMTMHLSVSEQYNCVMWSVVRVVSMWEESLERRGMKGEGKLRLRGLETKFGWDWHVQRRESGHAEQGAPGTSERRWWRPLKGPAERRSLFFSHFWPSESFLFSRKLCPLFKNWLESLEILLSQSLWFSFGKRLKGLRWKG